MIRALLLLVAVCCALLGAAPAQAAVKVRGFEEFPAGVEVRNQYGNSSVPVAERVVFGPGRPGADDNGGFVVTTASAHSGARSGYTCKRADCISQEFPSETEEYNAVRGSFASRKRLVEVWVERTSNVLLPKLRVYDDTGQLVDSHTGTSAFGWQKLSVSTSTARIAYFDVVSYGNVDDFTYDIPEPGTPPPPPSFTLTAVVGPDGLALAEGESAAVDVEVTRFDGSSGPISLSADLPKGVSATFDRNPLDGSALRSRVRVTLRAAQGAQAGLQFAHITGTPSSEAGTKESTASFPLEVLGDYDARITGIEVTQGIQGLFEPCYDVIACRDNWSLAPQYNGERVYGLPGLGEVPLARHGKTVVRVYGNTRVGRASGIEALLYGYRNGKQLKGPLLAQGGSRSLSPGEDRVSLSDRAFAGGAWTFTLPKSWAAGEVKIVAKLSRSSDPVLAPAAAECPSAQCATNNTATLHRVRFEPTPSLSVALVRMYGNDEWRELNSKKIVGGPFKGAGPGDQRFLPRPKDVMGYTEAVAPMAEGGLTYAPTYYTSLNIDNLYDPKFAPQGLPPDVPRRDHRALDRLEDLAEDQPGCSWSAFCATQVLGVIARRIGPGVSRGKLLAPALNFGDAPQPGVEQPIAVASTRSERVVAEEVMHGWGRVHADLVCGGNDNGQAGEANPPDDRGFIKGVGLDRREGFNGGRPYRVIAPGAHTGFSGEPKEWVDHMSYCPGSKWTSAFGWTKTFRLLQEYAKLRAGSSTANVSMASAARKPGLTLAATRPGTLRVRAIATVAGHVGITAVGPPGVRAVRYTGATPYVVRALDGAGRTITERPLRGEAVTESPGLTSLAADLPARRAKRVVIIRGGATVAQRARTARPRLRLVSPRRGSRVGAKRYVSVRWRVKDRDPRALLTSVDFSPNDGRTWFPLDLTSQRGRAVLPSASLARSKRARVRVRVNDGFNEARVVSARFRTAGRPPSVRISSPARGVRLRNQATVHLAGQAFDDAGRRLRGRRLTWYAGKRRIGRGEAASVAGLPRGRVRLRLVARDRFGRKSTARVTVRSVGSPPRIVRLKAPRKVSRRARRVRIRIATTVPARVRIRRQRFYVDRRARTLKVRVRRGRAPLRIKLRLGRGVAPLSLTIRR